MKKIKVALIAGKMVGGGVESLLMSISEYIDKDKFEVDLLVDNDSKLVPEEELKRYGINLIFIPPYQNIFSYLYKLRILFLRNNYDIVHSNISTLNVFPLSIAYFCRVPVRISHNHNLLSPNAGKLKNALKWFLSYFSNMFPNYCIAPTHETGKWVFKNKDFDIIKNGITPKKFIFDKTKRLELRKSIGVEENTILLGSFGRMVHSKNLIVTIKVLEQLLGSSNRYKLLLVGSGNDEIRLKKYVQGKNVLKNKVIFVPSQKDVSSYYSALDFYLFPSAAEAFGIAAIEAQTNGLITLVSRGVPDEAEVSDKLFKKFKNYDTRVWSNFILSTDKLSVQTRKNLSMKLKDVVFNSKNMVNEIEELYINAYKEQVE
ncbi:glycosyltransferase [Pediococcus pentosaceus]|uniref:glycosyltransferase n=1 Tax=Pediococcus pentosaceus TaxID=1255 RepID=UPI0021E9A1B5|nr:glycosyltransferase [Pediococcus pentosaceus]MCV3320377.1 glycosyltransferase [Pediococcus pentosaceus]